MKTRQRVFTLLLVTMTGLAVAGPRGGPPAFASIDADGNGVLTAAEHQQFRADRMAQRAAAGYRMRNAGQQGRFQAMDLNGDERVSQQEFLQWQAANRGNRSQGNGRGRGAGQGPRAW